MTGRPNRFRRGLLATAAALALLAAACSDDDDTGGSSSETTTGGGGGTDLSGQTVRVLGPETGAEADGVIAAFAPFEEATGATVEYTGTRDAETQVRTAAEAGGDALPDIFLAPQPGLVKDLASSITPLTAELAEKVKADYDPYLADLVTVDGNTLGIPVKGDVKSLVWYSPPVFAEGGYEVPETWDELIALQDQMKADGLTPWCIGIESGEATGWAFTDWMEDIMLRTAGPEVYDQWVNHEIPFNDPQVLEAANVLGEIWFTDGNVLGGRDAIASTGVQSAGLPVLDGDCGMVKISNFYVANFRDANPDVTFGEDGDINVFYLPTMNDDFGEVMLSGGMYAVAFNDKPSTLATMEYIESVDYANNRLRADIGGFITPNRNVDLTLYTDPLEQTFGELLVESDPVRFDASDLMPSAVGAGSFWKEGTNFVSGSIDAEQFLDNVEASWPSS
jgi:alpha-glucoside transport system substrate-binding protein